MTLEADFFEDCCNTVGRVRREEIKDRAAAAGLSLLAPPRVVERRPAVARARLLVGAVREEELRGGEVPLHGGTYESRFASEFAALRVHISASFQVALYVLEHTV